MQTPNVQIKKTAADYLKFVETLDSQGFKMGQIDMTGYKDDGHTSLFRTHVLNGNPFVVLHHSKAEENSIIEMKFAGEVFIKNLGTRDREVASDYFDQFTYMYDGWNTPEQLEANLKSFRALVAHLKGSHDSES